MHLTGFDHNSQLILKNITLVDPGVGTFQTRFTNITMDNIIVKSCSECSILRKLACDEYDFRSNYCGGIGCGLSCNELRVKIWKIS